MSMNVRQFLEMFVWPFTGQHGSTLALGQYGVLGAINLWLSHLYSKNWAYRSWAVKTEGLLSDVDSACKIVNIKTQFPIVRVTGIYTGPKQDIEADPDFEYDECATDEDVACSCLAWVSANDLKPIKPLNKVQPGGQPKKFGDYKIRGWSGFGWGTFGKIVSVYVWGENGSCTCNFETEGMYITYQAWCDLVTCYTDLIPLPDALYAQLAEWVIGLTMARSGNRKANEDTFWIQLATDLGINIDKIENQVPGKLDVKNVKNDPRRTRPGNSLWSM